MYVCMYVYIHVYMSICTYMRAWKKGLHVSTPLRSAGVKIPSTSRTLVPPSDHGAIGKDGRKSRLQGGSMLGLRKGKGAGGGLALRRPFGLPALLGSFEEQIQVSHPEKGPKKPTADYGGSSNQARRVGAAQAGLEGMQPTAPEYTPMQPSPPEAFDL